MINEITVRSEERINDKTYVCAECLMLLTLRGALRDCFILKTESDESITCDICGDEALFVVIPIERGIWVCDECLNIRGKRDVWGDFRVLKEDNEASCDICLRKRAKLISPLIGGGRKIAMLEEGKEQ